MGIIAALVIGAIAGWLAGLIVRGAGFGLIGNIVIGIIGALVASWLLPQLGVSLGGSALRDIVNATIGAVIVLVILSLIKRADRPLHSRSDRRSGGRFTVQAEAHPAHKNKQQGKRSMKFTGTKDYVATDDLKIAVNASIVLERPLLIKGEPGTGKTVLAEEVAKALGAPLLTWHIKSTTKAQQGLYEYDAVSRLRDSQLGDARVSDIAQLHQARQIVGGLHPRQAPGAADRRNRQGRHRISQRPAARTRSHGVLRLRDRREHQGRACARS